MQAFLLNDHFGSRNSEFTTPFEVYVDPDILRHQCKSFFEGRNTLSFELLALKDSGI